MLEEDGEEDGEARGAIAGCDLGRVVYAVAVEPCPVGNVEDVEKGGDEPVRGDGREGGEYGVREGCEEGGGRRIVEWVGVEKRVVLLLDARLEDRRSCQCREVGRRHDLTYNLAM